MRLRKICVWDTWIAKDGPSRSRRWNACVPEIWGNPGFQGCRPVPAVGHTAIPPIVLCIPWPWRSAFPPSRTLHIRVPGTDRGGRGWALAGGPSP